MAGLVSLIAVTGLVVQFSATEQEMAAIGPTLWRLFHFFTIWTNLLVAIVFGAVAAGLRRIAAPSPVGCAVTSILLVGVVFALLLRDVMPLTSGEAVLANSLLHQVTPVAVPLWWLAFGRKEPLRPRDPWIWALWPLVYVVYALARGTVGGRFAYPFLDYVDHGWGSVAANTVAMALGFVILGHAMLWISHRR